MFFAATLLLCTLFTGSPQNKARREKISLMMLLTMNAHALAKRQANLSRCPSPDDRASAMIEFVNPHCEAVMFIASDWPRSASATHRWLHLLLSRVAIAFARRLTGTSAARLSRLTSRLLNHVSIFSRAAEPKAWLTGVDAAVAISNKICRSMAYWVGSRNGNGCRRKR